MLESNVATDAVNQPPAPRVAKDDRAQRSREAVLHVTSELLTERGLNGVSVDEVSRRSGVAKTTIYRHWATRSALLMDACSRIITPQDVPNTGSFKGDLTALLTHLASGISTARWSSVMPSIIDAAERDPDLADIQRNIQLGHTTPFLKIIERGIHRDELVSTVDPSAMIAALIGPLFYRRWFSREPLDKAFIEGIVRDTLGMAQFYGRS